MQRWIRASALAVALASAPACSSHHHWIAAKYVHGTSWIRFDANGHFSLNVSGQFGTTGTYEIDDTDVELTLVTGGTRHCELEGRTFTDWLGQRYRLGRYHR